MFAYAVTSDGVARYRIGTYHLAAAVAVAGKFRGFGLTVEVVPAAT